MKKIGSSTYFSLLTAGVMLIVIIDATNMPFLAGLYPGIVAGVIFALAVAQVIQDFRIGQTTEGGIDIGKSEVPTAIRYRRGLRTYMWVLGLYLAIALFGFKVGAMAFLAGYLKIEDGSRPFKIVAICTIVFVILDIFRRFLGVWWPEGLLGDVLEESMPWLF